MSGPATSNVRLQLLITREKRLLRVGGGQKPATFRFWSASGVLAAVVPRMLHSAVRMAGPWHLVLDAAGVVGSLAGVRRHCWIRVPRDRHRDRRLLPGRDSLRAECGQQPNRKVIPCYLTRGAGT